MARVLTRSWDSNAGLLEKLAEIAESAFKPGSRFAMSEEAIGVLFSGIFRALADVEARDLVETLEHMHKHAEELPRMLGIREARRGEIRTVSAERASGVVSNLRRKWFPPAPISAPSP